MSPMHEYHFSLNGRYINTHFTLNEEQMGVYPHHHCHTRFSEGNQVHTYMHARIKFHAYSDI
jgi:hypothetical protein